MNKIFFISLSLSVSGSLLALTLLLLKPLVRTRLGQTWQYYIWLLVALRFLLPFSPEVSLIGGISGHLKSILSYSGIADTDNVLPVEFSAPQPEDLPTSSDSFVKQGVPDNLPEVSKEPFRLSNFLPFLWIPWLIIALFLLFYQIIIYQCYARKIKIKAKIPLDPQLLYLYHEEVAYARISSHLPLLINPQAPSPMLIGILQPVIILPNSDMEEDALRHTFRHELTHYRRLDALYKWFLQIILCIHWYNPMVYYIRKEINRCCELSCDENVIKNMDIDSRILYGDTLMNSLNKQVKNNSTITLPMGENTKLIKERLDMIMCFKKKSRSAICVTLLLTLILLCNFTYLGAYAGTVKNSLAASPQESSSPTPDSLSVTKTAKDITLSVINSNVIVHLSDTDHITFHYDKAIQRVTSVTNNDQIDLEVEGLKKSEDSKQLLSDIVIINLPKQSYDNITIDGRHSGISLPELDANLEVSSSYSSIKIQIPDNFTKTIHIKHQKGAGSMIFSSRARDYTVKIKSEGCALSVPSGLPPYTPDKTWVYKNGKGTAKITVDIKYSAFSLQFENKEADSDTSTASGTSVSHKSLTKTYQEKPDITEYEKWGVTVKGDVFYYKNKRVRIFMDTNSDHSFKYSNYDKDGSIDLRVKRNHKGEIVKKEQISKEEAMEIIYELDDTYGTFTNQVLTVSLNEKSAKSKKSPEDIRRLTAQELPAGIQDQLTVCKDKTWYVINSKDRRYLYYNGLDKDYAYQYDPDKNSIQITRAGKSSGYYVLLSLPAGPLGSNLKVTYQKHIVTCTELSDNN